jgi:hypothetical protein
VVGSGRYEVSPDGTTLIMSGDKFVIVCDRVSERVMAGAREYDRPLARRE